jgi:hypothetical protein
VFIVLVAWLVIAVIVMEFAIFAIDSKIAMYFGGTVTTFNGGKDPVEGLDTTNDQQLIFTASVVAAQVGQDQVGQRQIGVA